MFQDRQGIESSATYNGWMNKEGWRPVYANILNPLLAK